MLSRLACLFFVLLALPARSAIVTAEIGQSIYITNEGIATFSPLSPTTQQFQVSLSITPIGPGQYEPGYNERLAILEFPLSALGEFSSVHLRYESGRLLGEGAHRWDAYGDDGIIGNGEPTPNEPPFQGQTSFEAIYDITEFVRSLDGTSASHIAFMFRLNGPYPGPGFWSVSDNVQNVRLEVTPVPEPATSILFLGGLTACAASRRQRGARTPGL